MKRRPPLLILAILGSGVLGWAARGQDPTTDHLAETPLLGGPADAALHALGPPSRIHAIGDELLQWTWTGDSGTRPTITLHRDRVVHVDLVGTALPDEAATLPAVGVYVGQPVDELVERLGNPSEARIFPFYAEPGGHGAVVAVESVLVYGERWISIAGGRVLRIGGPPVAQRFHGPR